MISSGLEGTGLESRVRAGPPAPSGPGTGALEDHTVHVPADVGAVRRGLLRHLASPPPGSGTFRIRLGSPRTTRPRLRRHLAARTGAVQVDVGVAGAVHVHALGAPALLDYAAERAQSVRSGAAAPAGLPFQRRWGDDSRGWDGRLRLLSLVGGPANGVEDGDGVEVVAPLCDLAVFDRDDGDEVVVVGVPGADRSAVDCVFEDDD
jgi:hypothetical protein